jgi:hypothetical protein
MKTEERIQGDPRSLSNLFYYELYDGAGALLLKGDQAVIVRHDICFDWRNLHEVFEVRNLVSVTPTLAGRRSCLGLMFLCG